MVRKTTFSPCIACPDRFYGLAITHQMTNKTDKEKRWLSRYLFLCSSSQGSTVEQLRQDLRKWLSAPDPFTNRNIARGVHHDSRGNSNVVLPMWHIQGMEVGSNSFVDIRKREFFTLSHPAPCRHMFL